MKILCEVQDQVTRKACHIVESNYFDPDFGKLLEHIAFNHTSLTGEVAFLEYKKQLDGRVIKVVPYQTWNPWSNVIGYAQNETIFVNTRKLSLPLIDRVENIFHESTHIAGFSHKGNRVTEYNLKTFPYLASSIFVKFLRSKGLL